MPDAEGGDAGLLERSGGAGELLRFTTAGSVDDGKSTLIGRLLYDSKQTFDDQLAAIERTSRLRGDEYLNLALFTDGLRAEREQGITIDVAYRYFATPQRKFILADTPGHVQYTRNMVTGASTANLALILVDARAGLVEQTRRHAYLSSLVGIHHLVLCVNKMDLVGFDQEIFRGIQDEFNEFARLLDVADVVGIPISALEGDNVVTPSERTPWYTGPTLLDHLETVPITSDRNVTDARFPVQYVIRPQRSDFPDYRGYAGTVASGVFRSGDAVTVLPGMRETTILSVDAFEQQLAAAAAPMAVTLRLQDDLDISRGDMIVARASQPRQTQDLDAMICWMAESETMREGMRLSLKHTTRSARAIVRAIQYRLDINTLSLDTAADSLALNEIGRVHLRTTVPLFVDDYRTHHATGSFILIDDATNTTAAAGMILDPDA